MAEHGPTITAGSTARQVAEALDALRARRPLGNPFADHLKAGRVTRDDLRRVLRLEAWAAQAELTAYPLARLRHPDDVFLDLGDMAMGARTRQAAMARAVGLSEEQLLQAPWSTAAFAYPSMMCWVALHHNRAEIGMTIYADLNRYQLGSLEVAERLRAAEPGVPQEFVEYFEAGIPTELCGRALAFAQKGLDAGDDPGRALNTGRIMEECVEQYWRAAVPDPSNWATDTNGDERRAGR
ncbi:hypothetical protein [Bailinhaonella thermotolerans]|uniref:Thiaminase-2/PQQC domain-containing protein n=1 Tax=Bailinhaonella thermotolerans TaxID=1070861 RepID=A0A3A4A5W0_9ACTN|nr:hypothetical protein [Bailinhaonella thermotolerans]RJL23251.1 hypothetical protein D5H75_33315 [Bailinhaonella thermotolerans]